MRRDASRKRLRPDARPPELSAWSRHDWQGAGRTRGAEGRRGRQAERIEYDEILRLFSACSLAGSNTIPASRTSAGIAAVPGVGNTRFTSLIVVSAQNPKVVRMV